MPNTKSAEKAVRQALRKRQHNLSWKRKVADAKKQLKKDLETKGQDIAILKKQESVFQKLLDKAAKVKAIHKNEANRLKSRYAKKITAYEQPAKKAAKKGNSKS